MECSSKHAEKVFRDYPAELQFLLCCWLCEFACFMKLSSAPIHFHPEVTCNKSGLRALKPGNRFLKAFTTSGLPSSALTLTGTQWNHSPMPGDVYRVSMRTSTQLSSCLLSTSSMACAYSLQSIDSSTSVGKFFKLQPFT